MEYFVGKQWGNGSANIVLSLPITFTKQSFRGVAVEGPGASSTSSTTVRYLTTNTIYLNNNYSDTSCSYIVVGI